MDKEFESKYVFEKGNKYSGMSLYVMSHELQSWGLELRWAVKQLEVNVHK